MKAKTITIILAILLLIALGYIFFDKYQESKQIELQGAFQLGYEQAILQIINQAPECKPIPIHTNNTTLNLIDIVCLKQSN